MEVASPEKHPLFLNPWQLTAKNTPFFQQIHGPCLAQKITPFSVELQTSMASIFAPEHRARAQKAILEIAFLSAGLFVPLFALHFLLGHDVSFKNIETSQYI